MHNNTKIYYSSHGEAIKRLEKIILFFLRLLPLTIVCCNTNLILGQTKYIVTKKNINVNDGLLSRDVFCAAQDSSGFMWFAINGGFQRYDGKSFRNYNFPELKDKNINALEIHGHYIIICANAYERENSINYVFDITAQKLINFKEAFPDAPFEGWDVLHLSHDGSKLQFVLKDPFSLWQLTDSSEFHLRATLPKWLSATPKQLNNFIRSNFHQGNAFLFSFSNTNAYAIFHDQPFEFLKANQREIPISLIDQTLYTCSSTASNEVYLQKREIVSKGSNAYSITQPTPFYPIQKFSSYTYQSNSNCFALEGPESGLVLYTPRELITVIDPEEYAEGMAIGLHSIFCDKQNNYWICGTNGIWKVSIETNYFRSYLTQQQTKTNKSNAVRGICSYNGEIWVNTWSNIWNIDKNKMRPFETDGIPYAITTHNNRLYAGTGKLLELKTKNKQAIEVHDFNDEIWSLYSFNNERLIIGKAHGIDVINTSTNEIIPIRCIDTLTRQPQFTYRIVSTQNHELAAIGDLGIYFINQQFEIVDHYGANAADPSHRICNTQIFDALEDRPGSWWIATKGEGLLHITRNNGDRSDGYHKETFGLMNGSPSDILYRIEIDEKQNLWISTYNGLMRFNTHTHSTKAYNLTQGICNSEFNRISSYKSPTGDMYFGTVNGLIAFRPSEFPEQEITKCIPFELITISKLNSIQDTLINCYNDWLNGKRITLEPHEKSLTLEFNLLDYNPENHLYSYKIQGFDSVWQPLSESNLRVNTLPPGQYNILIRARLSDGSWNTKEIRVPIEVIAVYYRRPWFFFLASLVFIGTILLLSYVRNMKAKRDRIQLEKKVLLRTRQLKATMNKKDLLLQEVHHRVKNNLQVISGLIYMQKSTLKDPNAKSILGISEGRIQAIALLHKNMYMQDNLGQINISNFLTDLFEHLSKSYYPEKKTVVLKMDIPSPFLDIDTASPFGIIANELLSNTFQHAFIGRDEVTVSMNLRTLENGDYLFVYKDDGSGFSTDLNPELRQSLGMQLIVGLAKQLMGSVKQFSTSGCHFEVHFMNKTKRDLT